MKHFEILCRKYTAVLVATFPNNHAVILMPSKRRHVCNANVGRPG